MKFTKLRNPTPTLPSSFQGEISRKLSSTFILPFYDFRFNFQLRCSHARTHARTHTHTYTFFIYHSFDEISTFQLTNVSRLCHARTRTQTRAPFSLSLSFFLREYKKPIISGRKKISFSHNLIPNFFLRIEEEP